MKLSRSGEWVVVITWMPFFAVCRSIRSIKRCSLVGWMPLSISSRSRRLSAWRRAARPAWRGSATCRPTRCRRTPFVRSSRDNEVYPAIGVAWKLKARHVHGVSSSHPTGQCFLATAVTANLLEYSRQILPMVTQSRRTRKTRVPHRQAPVPGSVLSERPQVPLRNNALRGLRHASNRTTLRRSRVPANGRTTA